MTFPDYADWLTPERLAAEEALWAVDWPALPWAEKIAGLLRDNHWTKVTEAGCGAGWLASQLPEEAGYIGIDNNPHCLALAERKSPGKRFVHGELRTVEVPNTDLLISFSVLKHLADWEPVLVRFLERSEYGLFTILVSHGDPFDDGTEYHHVWVAGDALEHAIRTAGHELLGATITHKTEKGSEWAVETRRISR